MSAGANDTVTNKQLLDEIIRSRNDLKNSIEASEARLLLKIESANNKISNLEKENIELKERIEQLESENRRKNIVLFGIERPVGIINPDFICGKLNSLLNIELSESDIADIHLIGKTETCPIKVQISSYFKKNLVLRNCNRLKGTGISIANDLSVKQRQANKILRKHLTLARLDGKHKKCYIRNNKLFVDDTSYTAEELEQQNNVYQSGEAKSSSAPSTPSKNPSSSGNRSAVQQVNVAKQISTETATKSSETPKKTATKEASVIQAQKIRNTRATANSMLLK